MSVAVGFLMLASCRGWHDPVPFDECQPYPLECPDCTFDDDRATGAGSVLRVWRCEDPDFGSLGAVRRRADYVPASDTHFYDLASGVRVASVREYDDPVPVCGRETSEEWWGEVLACVDSCELDLTRPEADPELGECAEA